MVIMVDDHTRMSTPDLNYEYYLPPITELEYEENEEGPGDDNPPENVSDTEDGIPS